MRYFDEKSFTELGLTDGDYAAVKEFEEFAVATENHVRDPLQLPEPGFHLDLDARAESATRQFKHIHQMCLMHASHFQRANAIKLAYLLDSYLVAASRLNPLGVYNAARAILELQMMVAYVNSLLAKAAGGERAEWQSRGCRYFATILRARYGTTDPFLREKLGALGVPPEALKLFRIKDARHDLAERHPWVEAHYVRLCDFVHHNLLSQRTAGADVGSASVAFTGAGGMMLLNEAGRIVEYAFPARESGLGAVGQTVHRALEGANMVRESLNGMPVTPYSESELTDWVGSPIGVEILDDALSKLNERSYYDVGRNDLCPCGSGKKFKRCHDRAV